MPVLLSYRNQSVDLRATLAFNGLSFNFYQFNGMSERVAVCPKIANCLFKINNKGFKVYPREAL